MSSSPVASDIVPTLLRAHSISLQPLTYSNTAPSSFCQPPISKHLQHTSDIRHCSSDPLILLLNLNRDVIHLESICPHIEVVVAMVVTWHTATSLVMCSGSHVKMEVTVVVAGHHNGGYERALGLGIVQVHFNIESCDSEFEMNLNKIISLTTITYRFAMSTATTATNSHHHQQ